MRPICVKKPRPHCRHIREGGALRLLIALSLLCTLFASALLLCSAMMLLVLCSLVCIRLVC